METYRLLKANPLKESSRDFLAWLSELPTAHQGQYKMVTTATNRQLYLGFVPPAQFLGTEMELVK